jgi:hypothetical protein
VESVKDGRQPKTRAEIFVEKKKIKKRLEAVGLIFLGVGLAVQFGALSKGERLRHPIWTVVEVLSFLLGVASVVFSVKLLGVIEHVPIYSPEFEQRIRTRYQSECDQLTNLGFDRTFYFGEAFPLIRLFLIFSALIVFMMWLKREVMTVHDSLKFMAGYPIFASRDKTAFAHPNGLGVKFHTAFQDGTILMTKNYGDATGYGPAVVAQCMKKASISELWTAHQRRTQEFEVEGKRVDSQVSFQAYSEISRKETAV